MSLAPIIIFAFNRPKEFSRCVEHLQGNIEAKESPLYVFVDGARETKIGEKEKVKQVRDMASKISGFKTVTLKFSDKNKGLAQSIISGTNEVIAKYGRVIVLEDDLLPMPNFLCYMNQMLERYELEKSIFQISGFGLKIRRPTNYPYDVYYHYKAQSWSWAIWKDRWETVDRRNVLFCQSVAFEERRAA